MPSQKAPSLLGWLTTSEEIDPLSLEGHELYEYEEVLVGRDKKRCRIVIDDPSISNVHLRVYSIIVEDERRQAFVYAQDISTNGSRWVSIYLKYDQGGAIGRGCAVLLSHGDKIKFCDDKTQLTFSAAPVSVTARVEPVADHVRIQDKEIGSFSNLYRMSDRQLGAGAFGTVLMAVDLFRSRQVACKLVSLADHQAVDERGFASKVWREVDLLKNISHANIIHIDRVFHTDFNIYIIEDLVAGGDLKSYIDRLDGRLADADASMIVYQILMALEYLHKSRIAHRDLKPENVLMSSPAVGARIILTDFGQSTKMSKQRMLSSVGTIDYVAPEVKGVNPRVESPGYTMGADMWSLGALTTTLFLGRSYFAHSQDSSFRVDSANAILEAAAACDLDALDHNALWKDINPRAKDLIKQLLVLDEAKRAKAKEALKHPWFMTDDNGTDIEARYQKITKDWMPTKARIDFREHLKIFENARRESDLAIAKSKAMLPPPKPEPRMIHRKHLPATLQEECKSPHFQGVEANRRAATILNQGEKRPFSVLKNAHENTGGHLKRTTHTGEQGKTNPISYTISSDKGSRVPLSDATPNKRFESSKTGPQYLLQDQSQACSPIDDEIDLYLQVGEERKGFRSAKSFGRAVAEQKKTRKL